MNILLAQLLLIIINASNAMFDAYLILKNKKIAHGINGAAYLIFAGLIAWLFSMDIKFLFGFIPYGEMLLFFTTAAFNRQLSFDILLNLRRGLEWYYQSTANPPKAIMDRIERFIFGTGKNVGKRIALVYFLLWCWLIILTVWLY